MMKFSRKLSVLMLCMSIIYFAILLLSIDLLQIPDIVKKSNSELILYAFIIMIASDLLNAFKINMILDMAFSFKFIMKMFVANQRTFFLSQFLPSDLLGITYRAKFISEFSSEDSSIYTIMYDKYTQVVSTMLLGLASTTILLFLWEHTIIFSIFLFLFVIILLIPIVLNTPSSKRIINKIFPASISNILIGRSAQIMTIFTMLKQVGGILILSSIIQLIFSLSVYILCISIGLKIDYLAIVIALCIVSLVIMLPVSYNGFGLREITLVFLLFLIRVPQEKAFVLSIYIMVLSFIKIFIGAIFNFVIIFKKRVGQLKK